LDDWLWVVMVSHQIYNASAPNMPFLSKIVNPYVKITFSIYKQLKFGPRVPKNASWKLQFGARMHIFRAQFLTKQHAFWWLEFGARMLKFGARIGLCWKSEIFHFLRFQIPFSWWITLKIIWKMSIKLVMIECHHNPKLASFLVLKEQT